MLFYCITPMQKEEEEEEEERLAKA